MQLFTLTVQSLTAQQCKGGLVVAQDGQIDHGLFMMNMVRIIEQIVKVGPRPPSSSPTISGLERELRKILRQQRKTFALLKT